MSDQPAPSPEQLRFVPYAQLVKMLVPSAGTISIYGPAHDLVWCSDGYERPDLRELLERAHREAGGNLAGRIENSPAGPTAYLTDLEDERGARLGSLVVELPEATGGRRSVAPSLLKPVVDCLESRLRLEHVPFDEPAAPDLGACMRLIDDDEALGPDAHRRHDGLTGLSTRTAFERDAQRALDASASRGAMLYVDVDHLHQVNDAFGFDCGDRVLSFVAERIRGRLEPTHVAGRLGGDRFAVMLPDADPDAARAVAERIQAALGEADYVHLEHSIPVTVTVGVAAAGSRSIRHLVAAAELASKRAKQRGSSRIVVSRNLGAAALARDGEELAYETFDAALADNALGLEAQPIIGLARDSGELAGFEVFVRMRNASGEWLSAHRFLRAAEYYGLMPAIDRWVIESTLNMLRDVADRLPELPLGVSVNVSSQSLTSGGYARFVLDLLGRAGLPAGLAGFELKESVAWSHLPDADRFVRTLGAVGSRVTLDNFGSGVGSITQLKSLAVKHIKIDGPLVRRSADDPESAALLRQLARAAAGLGLTTIAEQVETESLAAALGTLDIDYAQGHHFGPPAPLADWLGQLCAPRSDGNTALS